MCALLYSVRRGYKLVHELSMMMYSSASIKNQDRNSKMTNTHTACSFPNSRKELGQEEVRTTIVEVQPEYTGLSSDEAPSENVGEGEERVMNLTDGELWSSWFAFPAQEGWTLLRWAEKNKSDLLRFTRSLALDKPSVDVINGDNYKTFSALCRTTSSAYKVLILGFILLIRGVDHGTSMGRVLFGRLLKERMDELKIVASASEAQKGRNGEKGKTGKKSLADDHLLIALSVQQATKLFLRADELYRQGRYTATLEHLGMALLKLAPWDVAVLSSHSALSTAFAEMDQSIMLGIAQTATAIGISLSPLSRLITSNVGMRLYRLSHAACDYVRLCAVPLSPSPHAHTHRRATPELASEIRAKVDKPSRSSPSSRETCYGSLDLMELPPTPPPTPSPRLIPLDYSTSSQPSSSQEKQEPAHSKRADIDQSYEEQHDGGPFDPISLADSLDLDAADVARIDHTNPSAFQTSSWDGVLLPREARWMLETCLG